MYSLLHQKEIIADLYIIKGYCEFFFDEHFKWFQQGDALLHMPPSFISRHVLVRYFLMHQDHQKAMNEGWKSLDPFQDYKEYVDEQLKESQYFEVYRDKKVSMFFEESFNTLNHHYIKWVNTNLLVFSLFSKPPTARCVAQVLLKDYSAIEARSSITHVCLSWKKYRPQPLQGLCSRENEWERMCNLTHGCAFRY